MQSFWGADSDSPLKWPLVRLFYYAVLFYETFLHAGAIFSPGPNTFLCQNIWTQLLSLSAYFLPSAISCLLSLPLSKLKLYWVTWLMVPLAFLPPSPNYPVSSYCGETKLCVIYLQRNSTGLVKERCKSAWKVHNRELLLFWLNYFSSLFVCLMPTSNFCRIGTTSLFFHPTMFH